MSRVDYPNLESAAAPVITSPLTDPASDPAVHPSSPPSARELKPVSDVVRVLVADDEALSRRYMSQSLTTWGYDVETVGNGTQALVALSRAEAPRLAVLDWEMPGMSGIDVCRLVRSRTAHAYVYIVLVTSRDNRRHLIDGLTAGADDYLSKPVDERELEVRMRAGRRIVQLQDQLLEAHQALEHRALYDALTGAFNRGALMDNLRRELDRSRRKHSPLSVILMDVDHFKKVNDTHGHLAGDAVLRAVSASGKRMVRSYDTFGRYGGEEFLLIAPECSLDNATEIADRLRSAVAETVIQHDGVALSVTASFGVATCLGDMTAEALLGAADTGLYAAKAAGRNCVRTAVPT